jgi:hypothetical protein
MPPNVLRLSGCVSSPLEPLGFGALRVLPQTIQLIFNEL